MSKKTENISEVVAEIAVKPASRSRKNAPPVATEEHQVVRTWTAKVPVLTPEVITVPIAPALNNANESDEADDTDESGHDWVSAVWLCGRDRFGAKHSAAHRPRHQ